DQDPLAALTRFLEPLSKKSYRLVLAGANGQVLQLWRRRVERALGARLEPVQDWDAVRALKPDQPLLLVGPVEQGFLDHEEKIACVTLRDLAGQATGPRSRGFGINQLVDTQLRFGDVVVHIDHGLGILEGIETADDGNGGAEVMRLRYADDAVLLVPFKDIGLIGRYGGPEADVALGSLKGSACVKRRDETMKAIAGTAKRMVAALEQRAERRAKPLRPDRLQFERFCASFPFTLTDDQADAAEAVTADLAGGRPMDRLLCG